MPLRLYGRRLMLRPLAVQDFPEWSEVRRRNEQWLTQWEHGAPRRNSIRRSIATPSRPGARPRSDASAGLAYGFGVFVDQHLAGEVNLNHVLRGAMRQARSATGSTKPAPAED